MGKKQGRPLSYHENIHTLYLDYIHTKDTNTLIELTLLHEPNSKQSLPNGLNVRVHTKFKTPSFCRGYSTKMGSPRLVSLPAYTRGHTRGARKAGI